jgi:hypothetical protein
MSSKSSCPKECGPRGDIIPTLNTDEEQVDLSPKPHYSCFKSADASCDKPLSAEEVENTSTSKSEKEAACDKPKEEAESTACDKPEEEEVEEIKAAAVQEDEDGKQKRKEIEQSSLFKIASDAKSGDVHRTRTPSPDARESAPLAGATANVEKLVQGAEIRSRKSPSTKSPTKSPRELLQAVMLPPATSQQIYHDHAD